MNEPEHPQGTSSFLAVDLGATSGRVLVGSLSEGGLQLTEVSRFANPLIQLSGHFYWDLYALYQHIIDALRQMARQEVPIT